jgi:hypothetical protein
MRKIFVIAAVVFTAVLVFAFRLVLLAAGSALYVYLLPGILARQRHHLRHREITLFTAVAGWLVLPWFGALLYAASAGHNNALSVDATLATSALDD